MNPYASIFRIIVQSNFGGTFNTGWEYSPKAEEPTADIYWSDRTGRTQNQAQVEAYVHTTTQTAQAQGKAVEIWNVTPWGVRKVADIHDIDNWKSEVATQRTIERILAVGDELVANGTHTPEQAYAITSDIIATIK